MRIFGRNTPNNNQSAVRLLAKAYRRSGRGRNLLLAGTSALGIVVLCTVFSIAFGKIEADYLQSARTSGTVASTILERGTMEQYHAIRELDYIEDVGREVDAGTIRQGEDFWACLTVLDETAWEKMTVPAYTHIQGSYPRKEGELMLPVRALEALRITRPEIGMEIPLSAELDSGKRQDTVFTLCGWYRDYVDPAVYPPIGYVSEAQLEQWGGSLEEPDVLLISQKNTMDGYETEARLYEDVQVRDRVQQFHGGNRLLYFIMDDFVGGFRMAAICGGLVLLGVFFLIYNIFGISIQKEIRQIGLLDTLGTTQKQICAMYLRQTAATVLQGAMLGTALSAAVVLFAVPRALGNLYLYNYGKSAELMVFRPELLGTAVLFTVAVIFGAAAYTIVRAAGMTPLEALHFTGMTEKRKGSRKTAEIKRDKGKERQKQKEQSQKQQKQKQAQKPKKYLHTAFQKPVLYLAWQNVFRYKKRFFLTVLSLFLGVVTALGAVVLTKGTDQTYAIEKNRDFKIGGTIMGTVATVDGVEISNQDDEFELITPETKERLLAIQGMRRESADIIRGGYLFMDRTAEAVKPLAEAYGYGTHEEGGEADMEEEEPGLPDSWTYFFVQIVDEEYMQELEAYVKENHLKADIESLRNGTGAILLHYHALSPTLSEEADEKTGLPLTFWQFPSREERTEAWNTMDLAGFENWRRENCDIVQLEAAGFLNIRAKGFPKPQMYFTSSVMWYALVSEEGFQRLGTQEKMYGMEMDVERAHEPAAKAAVQKIIQDENRRDPSLYLRVYCKSDELASSQSYIRTNRIILGALSLVLILMGFLNYLNVIVTGILSRQRELAVMESVGMTGRQIQRMLAAEGAVYCGIVGALVSTVGSGILYLLKLYMEHRITYFKFLYPGAAAGGILALIFLACLSVPLIMYGHLEKRSLTRRTAEE